MAHPDDELLSALLDGEAPPGDVAHVDGCGDCQARLGDLRFVSQTLVASVPMPPGHLREASLAVALRAADEPARVPTLPARRLNALSAAAVLVVALAVGGLLITQLGRNDPSTTRTDDASVAAGLGTSAAPGERALDDAVSGSAGGAAESSDAAGSDAATLAAPAAAGSDIGSYDDIDAVSQRSTADLAGRDAKTASTVAFESLPCPPETSDEPVIWHATLTFKGTPAVATVRSRSGTTRVTEIRARSGCGLLATQEFEPTTPR